MIEEDCEGLELVALRLEEAAGGGCGILPADVGVWAAEAEDCKFGRGLGVLEAAAEEFANGAGDASGIIGEMSACCCSVCRGVCSCILGASVGVIGSVSDSG